MGLSGGAEERSESEAWFEDEDGEDEDVVGEVGKTGLSGASERSEEEEESLPRGRPFERRRRVETAAEGSGDLACAPSCLLVVVVVMVAEWLKDEEEEGEAVGLGDLAALDIFLLWGMFAL